MPTLANISTAVPPHTFSLQDVYSIGQVWLKDAPEALTLFERVVRSSPSTERSFILSPKDLLTLPGLEARAKLFEEWAPVLGVKALREAVTSVGIRANEIDVLVFTSCSCPTIPSVDAIIAEKLGLGESLLRIPIFQHGCAGGVVGLRIAQELAKAGRVVAVVNVELCSLVFHQGSIASSELIGAAIFSDGAAAAVILPSDGPGLRFIASYSYLVPDTRDLMGYDILDDGFHLRLAKELPRALSLEIPKQIDLFLGTQRLRRDDIDFWLFHPGGHKILDLLEDALALSPEQCHWARDVLSQEGNMSSATVMFVLKRFMREGVSTQGEKVMLVGVGPGLTIELILFSVAE